MGPAIVIGINRYPRSPLSGCVADAKAWATYLSDVGFDVRLLLDYEATRDNILTELRNLPSRTKCNEVTAFCFAGHGTRITGSHETYDECLCPVDLDRSGVIRDDWIGAALDAVPGTTWCFLDNCHSGNGTRLIQPADPPAGAVARMIALTPREAELTQQNRPRWVETQASYDRAGEVLCAACAPHEQSYESGGNGVFTKHATQILRDWGHDMTVESFMAVVRSRFSVGSFGTIQHPSLWCAPGAEHKKLFT